MARSFEIIHFDSGEKWSINAMNVTLVRPRTLEVRRHVEECDGREKCPFNPAMLVRLEVFGCMAEEIKGAEILFVNTIGQQSSVLTSMSREKVREQLDSALAG